LGLKFGAILTNFRTAWYLG